MAETVFSKILRKEINARLVHEDELCIAFHDVAPQAPTHILVIPRKPVESLAVCNSDDKALMGHLLDVVRQIAADLGIAADGYRVVINCGANGGQSVDHLHIHLLGGRAMTWPPG